MSHADLIDRLGGTGVVAKRLGVGASVVANWRERGISWRWRPLIGEWAKEQNIGVPVDFFEPQPEPPALQESRDAPAPVDKPLTAQNAGRGGDSPVPRAVQEDP